MSILACLVAGVFLGWFTFSFMGMNDGRNRFVAMVIGAMAAFGGFKLGEVVLGVAPGQGFSISVLIFASAVAAGCLFIASVVHSRWSI